MTCLVFLKNTSSYAHFCQCLEQFSIYSGLKVNAEKTEFLRLGLRNLEAFSQDLKTTLKILGVYFGYNKQTTNRENFEEVLKSMKISLNIWKGRGLTLIGKIQIVKSFAIPKFMSKAALIHVSKDLLRAVNEELYNFIWNGKDKVKRRA